MKYLDGISYLWMVFFIMISAGLAKEFNLFAPAYSYVKSTFKSNRIVVALLSAIGGILPIEGRVTVSAGLLDTVAPKDGCGRHKFGIVDYLSTHHYYLWSPLEKTVVIPIAVLGISYAAWIAMISPLLIATMAFIFLYVAKKIKEEEVIILEDEFKMSAVIRNVLPMFVAIGAYIAGANHVWCFGALAIYYMTITQQWNVVKLSKYINWQVLVIVAVAIIAGNYFKDQAGTFQEWIRGTSFDISTLTGIIVVSALGFTASFLMGSSGKFVAIAVLMAQLFGMEYFIWFFAVDYVGYLLSPTHKCVVVGNRYFGTPLKIYYSALGVWSVILLLTAGVTTYIKL